MSRSKPAGLIEAFDAGAEGARAMRAFLAGRPDEAARIRHEVSERSRTDAARYARDVSRIDPPDE